ncbi:MAG: hypothetical protein WCP77_02575 [Roseococcus sp.]
MTELRPTAHIEGVTPPFAPPPGPGWILRRGLAGFGLGAALTFLAVAWANGPLGLLSLIMVLGSLAWISIGLVRHHAARLRA